MKARIGERLLFHGKKVGSQTTPQRSSRSGATTAPLRTSSGSATAMSGSSSPGRTVRSCTATTQKLAPERPKAEREVPSLEP